MPESGLQTAIAALVAAGHKVGVMEQIETGEEAKKRDKNAIVRRKLTNVQTPATAFEPDDTDSVHLLSVLPVKATGVTTLPPSFRVLSFFCFVMTNVCYIYLSTSASDLT